MKIAKLLLCLCFPLFSFAQEEEDKSIKEYFLMRFEKEGKIVDDTLWAKYSGGECTFYLGKDSIGAAWNYISAPSQIISRLSPLGFYNSFLLQVHAGDGCPTLYQILQFSRDGKASLGEQFGNCNEAEKITIKGNSIQFDFPGMKEPKRPKVSHKVLIKN